MAQAQRLVQLSGANLDAYLSSAFSVPTRQYAKSNDCLLLKMPYANTRRDFGYSPQNYVNLTGEFAGREKEVFASPAFLAYAKERSQNEKLFLNLKDFTAKKLEKADREYAAQLNAPSFGTRKIENMTDNYKYTTRKNSKTNKNEACFAHEISTPCGSFKVEGKCYARKPFDFLNLKSKDSSHMPVYGFALAVIGAIIISRIVKSIKESLKTGEPEQKGSNDSQDNKAC